MSDGLDALALLGERMADQRDYVAELERENELLAAERDEAVELLEQALGALERERDLRLEVDNSVAQLLDAIKEHRRLITERVPQKSGRDIDESLWWWVK